MPIYVISTASRAEATSRAVEEQISCSLQLQGFLEAQSDPKRFIRVAIYGSLTPAITSHFNGALGY
jgi:hypothetical protein